MRDGSGEVIGRAGELAGLDRALADVLAGRGRVVLISGPAGIGKTRLVDELAGRVAALDVAVLRGQTMPGVGAPALWPWWQALAGRPELASLLDSHDSVELPEVRRGERLRAFDTLMRSLSEVAAPALVVLEDVHWAEEASLLLLRLGAGRAGLLLVATYRDDELSAALRDTVSHLRRDPATLMLRPQRWTSEQVGEFVAGAAHPTWAPVLHRLSGGVPLLVQALLDALVDARAAEWPAPDAWPLGIPEQLRGIVSGRLDRMSDLAREVVSACAVIGPGCDIHAVSALTGRPGPDVLRAVDEASGLLVRSGAAGVSFEHELLRDAVYETVPVEHRLDWHRRLAEAIESGELSGDAVTHRLRSITDEPSRLAAVAACRSAAAGSAEQLAFDRAAELLDTALALVGETAGEPRAELLLDSSDVEYRAGRIEVALRRCRAAADLTTRPDLLIRAALTVRGISGPASYGIVPLCERALAELPEEAEAGRARVLAQYALALSDTVHPDAADEPSAQALALAERSGDPLALADALRARQQVLSGPEGVTERLELARRMLALGSDAPPDGELWARLWRIDAALQLGSMSSLDEELNRLGLLADRLGWQLAYWHLHRMRAARALLHGKLDEALAENEKAHGYARLLQEPNTVAICVAFPAEVWQLTGKFNALPADFLDLVEQAPIAIAWAQYGGFLVEQGDLDGARLQFERLRPILHDLPHDGRWLPIVATAGQLAVAFGDTEVADWCYRELLPYRHYYLASGSGTVACRGAVARYLGDVAAGLGEHAAAVEHFTDAIAMEDRVGALSFRTLSQIGLAEVLVDDDPARAAEVARQAAITARRLGMAPALRRADALLERARRTWDSAVVLTAREREVLARLARGEANRAIAEALVLSERTVETHVSNVLGKLGVANRAQAAAWAVEHGFTT